MEIARSLRDERGGGDIITTDSGDEDQMHLSEKKVNYKSVIIPHYLIFYCSLSQPKSRNTIIFFVVISLATMG